eukprot:3808404-Pleurochrysis_carterae.AAC.1
MPLRPRPSRRGRGKDKLGRNRVRCCERRSRLESCSRMNREELRSWGRPSQCRRRDGRDDQGQKFW